MTVSNDLNQALAQDAIRHALDGTSVLFVGSGVGFLSANSTGEQLPDARALADALHVEAGVSPGRHNLQRISEFALKKLGVDRLIALLQGRLKVAQVDPRLTEIYRAPWQRIYTTNYDDAIEVSRMGPCIVSSFTTKDDPLKAPKGAIVHLNGFVDRIRPESIQHDVILTDLSYTLNDFQESDWARQFLIDIRTCRSLIFLGYSMADLDIARLLIEDPALSRKTIFFISPVADEIEIESLSDYGKVIEGGFDRLDSEFSLIKKSYTPSTIAPFTELHEIVKDELELTAEPESQLVYSQLVFGHVAEANFLLSRQVIPGVDYVGNRAQVTEALTSLGRGIARDLVIHGEIASGKSCACLLAARHFLDSGYRVFNAKLGTNLISDLERLADADVPACVIFDGYASFMDAIRVFSGRRKANHRMVLSEKTVTHELIANAVESFSGFGPNVECHLGRISDVDADNFSELINFAGLWGDRSGLSLASKSTYLRSKLGGSLYLALLEVIKSKKVQEDIRRLLEPLTFDRKALKVFVSAFIVNALGFKFEINDWQSFYQIDSIRRIARTYTEQFGNFMSVSGDELTPRSGLLSAHILKTFAADQDIVDSLVALYTAAERGEDYDDYLAELRVELMRYGAIEPMFGDKNKYAWVTEYYNRVRAVGDTVNNADYWLQAGIAATAHDDLETAQIAFDNAYARERKKKNPKLRRIDNYYSRFQMKKAIAEMDSAFAFRIFSEANIRLTKQVFEDNNRHYPFKTSREFVGVAAKHFDKWSSEQRDQFVQMTRDIRNRAIRYQEKWGDTSADVAYLIRETAALLGRLDQTE